jgi:hypothetical protein
MFKRKEVIRNPGRGFRTERANELRPLKMMTPPIVVVVVVVIREDEMGVPCSSYAMIRNGRHNVDRKTQWKTYAWLEYY